MRGKKTSTEDVVKIMVAWAESPTNLSEVARVSGMPDTTVRQVVAKYADDPTFAKLREQKTDEFAQKATEIIDLALKRLKNEIQTGEHIPANQLSTVIGTLYDKRALSQGQSTENVAVKGDIDIAKLADLAGYERK